jgi:hypothetical protein
LGISAEHVCVDVGVALRLLLCVVVVVGVVVVVVVEVVLGSDDVVVVVVVGVENGFRRVAVDEVEVDSSCRATTVLAEKCALTRDNIPTLSELTGTMLFSIHHPVSCQECREAGPGYLTSSC